MWKLLYQSVRGTSHVRTDTPCQDNCLATTLLLPNEAVVILSCADGAGSAEHSRLGSERVCSAAISIIADHIGGLNRLPVLSSAEAMQWIDEIQSALKAIAADRAIDIRSLATTLLVAIIGESSGYFLQIGDGVIVFREEQEYRYVFWPQSGEYANTTFFVTDAKVADRVQFTHFDRRIDEVALLTDGLQTLALSYADRSVHGPFFAPLFTALDNCTAEDELVAPMTAFLNSSPVNDRTDDDKTLVLALRRCKTHATL